MFSTCKNKGVYKVNMESGAECLLNVNLTPEGIEQKKATFPVITIVIRRQQNTRQEIYDLERASN